MLPVQAAIPGAPGRWGSPFSRPGLIDLRRHKRGLIVPRGHFLIACSEGAWVDMRVRMDLTHPPPPRRSPDPPPPSWPPGKPWPLPHHRKPPWWAVFTLVRPGQTLPVWSDGQNIRLSGWGRAMLIHVYR
jgi:hypothetical protein